MAEQAKKPVAHVTFAYVAFIQVDGAPEAERHAVLSKLPNKVRVFYSGGDTSKGPHVTVGFTDPTGLAAALEALGVRVEVASDPQNFNDAVKEMPGGQRLDLTHFVSK